MRTRSQPIQFVALWVAVALPALPLFGAKAVDGRKVFEAQKCNLCHSVSTAGIEAKTTSDKAKGPDLVDVDNRTVTYRFLKEGSPDAEGGHRRPFKGSDEELQALVDWLLEQKSER